MSIENNITLSIRKKSNLYLHNNQEKYLQYDKAKNSLEFHNIKFIKESKVKPKNKIKEKNKKTTETLTFCVLKLTKFVFKVQRKF